MIEPQWVMDPAFEETQQRLPPDLPRIVKLLLAQRAVTSAHEVEQFLSPKLATLGDPFVLLEMDRAVTRLFQAIDRAEQIVLFGDYDVDGISSLALLSEVLELYGVEAKTFIPLRSSEGYGLNSKTMARLLREFPAVNLLVTLDCGTSSKMEIQALAEHGVEVIVVDHHETSAENRAECCAIVNPKANRREEPFDLSALCAAGVTFKLAHALLKTRPQPDYHLKSTLDLVALATVADIVPLTGENRTFVKHGLRQLAQTPRRGLQVLKEIAGVGDHPEASDIGYRLGPRLNAAGRMDAPLSALELLQTSCADRADQLARALEGYNSQRRESEKSMLSEAERALQTEADLEQDSVIVLARPGWHPGVVGIVASRLMRRYHKPTFIIALDENGEGKGSGRSLNELSLVSGIKACQSSLIGGGGHHLAAGITIRADQVSAFRHGLDAYFKQTTTAQQRQARLSIQTEVEFAELDFLFFNQYERLKPFGAKNRQPTFLSRQVSLERPIRRLKNDHLKFFFVQNGVSLEAIYFGGGAQILPPFPWDIAYQVDKNVFRGQTSLQLNIQAVRAAEPANCAR